MTRTHLGPFASGHPGERCTILLPLARRASLKSCRTILISSVPRGEAAPHHRLYVVIYMTRPRPRIWWYRNRGQVNLAVALGHDGQPVSSLTIRLTTGPG